MKKNTILIVDCSLQKKNVQLGKKICKKQIEKVKAS